MTRTASSDEPLRDPREASPAICAGLRFFGAIESLCDLRNLSRATRIRTIEGRPTRVHLSHDGASVVLERAGATLQWQAINSSTERTFERHGERRARAVDHAGVCTAPIARHSPARAMMLSNLR